MTDSAKGPSSGYIYQFEIGLLELLRLKKHEFLSIEKGDDIAVEDSKGLYLMTVQAKHTISSTGKNFGNTSKDLWKTLALWIEKIKLGTISNNNRFIAVINSSTPNNSIVNVIGKKSFEDIWERIEKIKLQQSEKLKSISKSGASIQFILQKIDYVLSHKLEFKQVIDNFELIQYNNVRDEFLTNVSLSGANDEIKDEFYYNIFGWFVTSCKEAWLNKTEAKFSRSDFDTKFNSLRDKHIIMKAVFRTKNSLDSLNPIDFDGIDYNSLYIKQIEEIERNDEDKQEIIKNAIVDFILRDIEVTYLISKDNSQITKYDFEEFEKKCEEKWKEVRRQIIKRNSSQYSEEELNDFAITVYDKVMIELEIKFQDYFGFNDMNRYIQNGTFLSLSNLPKIGWHPEWKKKYLKDD